MASNYPGSLDSFDTIASDKKTSDTVGGRTHRDMHNDLGDAIEAVQTELGTNPSGSYDTVKARFEALEGSTLPQIDAKGDLIVGTADNTYDNLGVGTNDTVLVADSGQAKGVKWAQVPTAGIADSAVTSAKIANGTIATGDIADSAVTDAKLAGSITPSKITGTALVASTIDAKGDLLAGTADNTAARLPVGSDGAVLMADSTQATGVKWAAAPYVNLLLADQSNFETGTTGWGTSNVTVTRTTASYKSGTASMRVASSTDSSTTKRARTSTRPAVTAGKTYTICASLKGDGTTPYRLTVLWYNAASGGTIIATVNNGAYVTASAGWFDERMELVAPAGATHCEINVYVDNATLTGGYVDVDEVAIWEGIGGTWSQGGTQITGTTGVAFTKTLYVDTATGAAANPGTAALPVAKLSQAVTLAGVTASTIKVKSTAAAPVRETGLVSLPATLPSVTIESGYAGRPWYFSGCTPVTSGWSAAGGGVYSRSLSVSTDRVYVSSLSETVGDRQFVLSLAKNTGTPTTPGEGEFGWASNVLYVKLPSSADPNSHTIQIPNATYSITSYCPNAVLRDARIIYSNWTAVLADGGDLTAYDSVAMHSGASAWASSTNADITLHRCYGWRARNDGFNIHGTGNALLIDCDGSYNDDEGASAHDTSYMEITGGQYRYNKQSGTGNVNDCTVVIGGNPLFERNQRDGIPSPEGGGIAAFDNCRTIIVSATCANNTGSGVRSTSSVAVQVDGLLSGTGQGNTSADYGI